MRVSIVDAGWWTLGALVAGALVLPVNSVSDSLGWRRFLTPEISSAWTVGQRFRMDADDLSGFELHASAVRPVEGAFRLRLRDVTDGKIERIADVPASDLAGDDSYVFRFTPFQFSKDHEFRFDIAPSPGNSGRGVALWATKGNRLDEGSLLINEVPRWASLAFKTHTSAERPIRALLTNSESRRPPRWLALIGLLGAWLALRVVLKALVAYRDDSVLAQ
jgi:hypothetical protein